VCLQLIQFSVTTKGIDGFSKTSAGSESAYDESGKPPNIYFYTRRGFLTLGFILTQRKSVGIRHMDDMGWIGPRLE
jgi:hypothetical protein